MLEPKPFNLAQLFSSLTGRSISFSLVTTPTESKVHPLYGVYTELPSESPIVVKADLAVIASFAAALLGMPDATALERASQNPMDEPVRDAMHEVLNIASTALSTEGRTIFKTMTTDTVYFSSQALAVLKSPSFKSIYNVSIQGGVSGLFTIYSPV